MKTYLENEIQEIQRERKCDNRHAKLRENLQIKKLMFIVLLLIAILGSQYSHADMYVQCPSCECVQLLQDHSIIYGKFFPDTWTCQKPRCGYKNYEGIWYCALCGTKRGENSPRSD